MKFKVTLNEGDLATLIIKAMEARGYTVPSGKVFFSSHPYHDAFDRPTGLSIVEASADVEIHEQ